MPYKISKQNCTRSDGKKGKYVLKYKPKKRTKKKKDSQGFVKAGCHTSKDKANAQRAAIEGGPREADEASYDEELREQDPGNKFSGKDYASNPTGTTTVTYGESLVREYIRGMLFERMTGDEIASAGSEYEVKLVDDLEAVGIRTAGVAGFTAAADVTIVAPDGKSYGIEAKLSPTADMGSAGMRYNPDSHTLSVSNPKSPIGAEVQKRLETVHSDTDFMDSIKAIYDAGFLQSRKPAIDMVAWRESTGLPSQPGRSYRVGESDLIARHYQAKGETAEYIQIKGWGLYIMNPKNDPLNLSALGVIPLSAPVSISVKVAQKGSSTPKPGKISSLSMSAKAKVMKRGMEKSGFNLDNASDLVRLKNHLGDYPGDSLSESVIRVLIKEELNGSDKTEINRMIKKAIEKDRKQQRKLMQSEIASEMKNTKITKVIKELAAEELKREMTKEHKGKEFQVAVTEITKKVIKKLYRELSFSYNPVIDRIKL